MRTWAASASPSPARLLRGFRSPAPPGPEPATVGAGPSAPKAAAAATTARPARARARLRLVELLALGLQAVARPAAQHPRRHILDAVHAAADRVPARLRASEAPPPGSSLGTRRPRAAPHGEEPLPLPPVTPAVQPTPRPPRLRTLRPPPPPGPRDSWRGPPTASLDQPLDAQEPLRCAHCGPLGLPGHPAMQPSVTQNALPCTLPVPQDALPSTLWSPGTP